jgi:hypothetical protein
VIQYNKKYIKKIIKKKQKKIAVWKKFLLAVKIIFTKGQLILKCPFGVFKSPQKKKTKFFARISALASKKKLNKK